MLTDRMLARVLEEDAPLADLAAQLIAEANARGGRDNITAVLVKILPEA
jgi:serine/threonine protein phosphatase PrpC